MASPWTCGPAAPVLKDARPGASAPGGSAGAVAAKDAATGRPTLIALIAAGLLLSLAAACSEGGGSQAATTPAATAATTPSPSPTPKPDLGPARFDSSRALAHVRELSVDIGVRASGTKGEQRAAQYIRDEMASYGYRARLQPFPVRTFEQVRADISVTAPEARSIPAEALVFSTSGTAEAEVVAAGIGRPQDFPEDTPGKLALIERGEIFFRDKVRNAAEAGAAAAIVYNNEPGELHASLGEESAIPAVAVAQAYGQELLDLLAAGPVTVSLDVETRIGEGESQNVVAEPRGQPCRVVAGGHYDSVPQGPGANDNASGAATVIEMARTLAADGEADPVCFVLFGSEEVGLVGSAYYVGSLSAEERAQMEAMLNFDMLGVGGRWPLSGSQEIVTLAAAEAETLGLDFATNTDLPPGAGSDHANFIEAGIPAILFNCFCDEHYHTADDRFEFVQEPRLAEAGALGLGVIERLLAPPNP